MQNDKISLRDAMTNPAWLMVYAAEPGRNVDVTMTYADLFAVYQWVKDLPMQDAERAESTERVIE